MIGCGRVGVTLGYFLKKRELLFGLYDKNERTQNQAVKILKIRKNPEYTQLIKQSTVLIFATPDDEILHAYHKAQKYITSTKYIFHFSGLLPAEIFPRQKNVYRGSLHPFATFPRIIIPPKQKKYFLFFQGDQLSYHMARKIFPKKNFRIRKITKSQKPFYHLLGVFASNFLVALNEAIGQLAKRIRWSKHDFQEVIIPIMLETINNLKYCEGKKALSGPVVRGDIKSIKKHLTILKYDRKIYDTYRILSRILLKYAPKDKKNALHLILKSD